MGDPGRRGEPAACELLRDVEDDWLRHGPLRLLLELSREVWRTNVNRHEAVLGDDAQTLGILASRNLCNLAVAKLAGTPGVLAQDRRTLEVCYGGRVLHTGKAPSDAVSWDVMSMDWSTSEVRDDAARLNSIAYQPAQGTLFEQQPWPGLRVDAAALSQLHLTWQGFPDGTSRAWLGFPRLGPLAWFAVSALDEPDRRSGYDEDGGPAGPATDGPPSDGPAFDTLGEPPIPITRRRTTAAARPDRRPS